VGVKYIYIFNYKGEVLGDFSLEINNKVVDNTADIILLDLLRKEIISYCSQYIKYLLLP
jgi:hypothetical protein